MDPLRQCAARKHIEPPPLLLSAPFVAPHIPCPSPSTLAQRSIPPPPFARGSRRDDEAVPRRRPDGRVRRCQPMGRVDAVAVRARSRRIQRWLFRIRQGAGQPTTQSALTLSEPGPALDCIYLLSPHSARCPPPPASGHLLSRHYQPCGPRVRMARLPHRTLPPKRRSSTYLIFLRSPYVPTYQSRSSHGH